MYRKNTRSREEGVKRQFSLLFMLLCAFCGAQGDDLGVVQISKMTNDPKIQRSSEDRTSENDVINNYFKFNPDVKYSSSENLFITQLGSIYKPLRVPIKQSVIRNSDSKSKKQILKKSSLVENSRTFRNSEFSSGPKRRVKRIVSQNLVRNRNSGRSLPVDEDSFKRRESKGREGPKRSPDIDGIIHGIMKLLGGNVKLKAPEKPDTKLTTFGGGPSRLVTSTRINNRGPPRLPHIPFGMLPPGLTRPPIRPPITSPSGTESHNGLAFVANTRPPFLVPLPPALSTRMTETPPALTGIPIPEDLLHNLKLTSEVPEEDASTVHVNPSYATTEDVITTSSTLEETETEAQDNEEETSRPPLEEPTSSSSLPEINSSSDEPVTTKSLSTLESSMTSLETSSTETTTATKTINLISSTIKTLKTQPSEILSSKIEQIQSSEFSSHFSTTALTTEVPLTKTTFDLIGSEPSTISDIRPKSTMFTKNKFSFSEFPTLLPDPIRPLMTTGHPGMVLEDIVDSSNQQTSFPEVITAPVYDNDFGSGPQIFDVTVSALQGYGGAAPPVTKYLGNVVGSSKLITSADKPADGSVFIDGRKTYFDLGLTPVTQTQSRPSSQTLGVGTVIPEPPSKRPQPPPSRPAPSRPGSFRPFPPKKIPATTHRPKTPYKPSTLGPPRRIDTCVVGHDNTCNKDLGEVCRIEGDVSSCFCRPGTARRRPRTKCKKITLLHLSMKVDRVGDRRIAWGVNYGNPESREFKVLRYEADKGLESALGQSQALSQFYLESSINKFYSMGGRVIVNSTVKLLHTPQTASPKIKRSIQMLLLRVIKANNNYIGNSVLSVEGARNPIVDVSDVNECFDPSLYDCNKHAFCTNLFGSYDCTCDKGFTDRYPDDQDMSGRYCDSCSKDYCNKRGKCRIEDGANVCACESSYYGARCEIDGEVVGVAVGASVTAVVIIVLTLIFLCMWSRRWKAQDQKKTQFLTRREGGLFGGWRNRVGRDGIAVHQKGGSNPYGVTMEDRIRWAQLAEQMAQQNIYANNADGSATNASMAGAAISNLGIPPGAKSEWNGGRVVGDLKRIFNKISFKRRNQPPPPEGHFTPEETQTLRQLISLQTRLAPASSHQNQPDQMRPAVAYYQEQMKTLPLPNEYATIGAASGMPQHFGMQHMNPQFNYAASTAASNYGQFGPMHMTNASSVGGISRAPTLGARTPLPMRDLLGGPATIGPFGGGAVSHNLAHHDMGGVTESSEEDMDRPYQMPRPKSRGSALDSTDIYFEPDNNMTSRYPPPLPLSPPPPVPLTFDHFFNTRFH